MANVDIRLLVGALVLVGACKDASAPTPTEQAAAASDRAPIDPAAAPEVPSPPSSNDSDPIASETAGTILEPTKSAEPPPSPPPPPPPPPPPFSELPTDPAIDPLKFLLGAGNPDTVDVLAVDEHGRRRVVLYRVDLVERWTASRPDDDPVLEQLEQDLQECESTDGYGYVSCRTEAARKAKLSEELAIHFAHESSYAWELAHVEFDQQGRGRVLASKRLLDHGVAIETDLAETKLKVYDMDGDKRSEVLVVFAVGLGSDALESTEAAVGFVLDKVDLHVQFATTRNYFHEASDLSSHETEIETTWVARDENGDGHNDLVVRERSRESYHPGESESEEPPSNTIENRSTVCIYELAGDRWVCPESLGTKVIDGAKLVEVTSVPVVLEAPAEPKPNE